MRYGFVCGFCLILAACGGGGGTTGSTQTTTLLPEPGPGPAAPLPPAEPGVPFPVEGVYSATGPRLLAGGGLGTGTVTLTFNADDTITVATDGTTRVARYDGVDAFRDGTLVVKPGRPVVFSADQSAFVALVIDGATITALEDTTSAPANALSGGATYQGSGQLYLRGGQELRGTTRLNADFANNALTGTWDLAGTSNDLTFTGNINGARFAAGLTRTGVPAMKGRIEGTISGPGGEVLTGQVRVEDFDGQGGARGVGVIEMERE